MSPRRLLSLVLTVVLGVLAVLAATPPAQAAPKSYSWQGGQDGAWGNDKNWSPQGVPEDGDMVTIQPGLHNDITGVPTITLSSFTVSAQPDQPVFLSGPGTISVEGPFNWQGGDIGVDLVLGPLSVGAITPQAPMHFGYETGQTLRVDGTLGITGPSPSDGAVLEMMFDSSLIVGSTGRLGFALGASISGNRCCVSPTSTLVVEGGIVVQDGTTTHLDNLGLDLDGTIDVPDDVTLTLAGGPVRIGAATLSGGGHVAVTSTGGDAFDPAHPTLPDSTMKLSGDLTFADDTTLTVGDHAEIGGVGRLTGAGDLVLAGPRIRGAITTQVPVTTLAGTTTHLVDADPAVAGQHGVLTVADGAQVAPGSTLQIDGGTRLVVAKDARLDLPAGAKVTADGCCTQRGELTVKDGGTLAVGAGTGDPTLLQWISLDGAGTVRHTGSSTWDDVEGAFVTGATITGEGTIEGDLPSGAATVVPTGILHVTGDWVPNAGGTYRVTVPPPGTTATPRLVIDGTARLAGRLESTGSTRRPVGSVFAILGAGTVTGRFACASTPGLLPTYATRGVSLQGIDLRTSLCVAPASGGVLSATFSGRRIAALRGVPSTAHHALLHLTLPRTARPTKLTLRAGSHPAVTVRSSTSEPTSTWVLVPIGSDRRLQVSLDRRTRVAITWAGWTI